MPKLNVRRGGSRDTPGGIYKIPVFGYQDFSDTAMRYVSAKSADALLKAELAVLISRDPLQIRLNQEKQSYRWSCPTISYADILNSVGLGDDDVVEVSKSREKIYGWVTAVDTRAPLIARGLYRQIEIPDNKEVAFERKSVSLERRLRIVEMIRRQGGRCSFCLDTLMENDATFDHEYPVSRFEQDDRIWVKDEVGRIVPQNYALHFACNQMKRADRLDLPHISDEIIEILAMCREKGEQYQPRNLDYGENVSVRREASSISLGDPVAVSGDGGHSSPGGKMRSHSRKKVRQMQRQRPAGYKGSRGDHDPQYFDRETIRGLGEFENADGFEIVDEDGEPMESESTEESLA